MIFLIGVPIYILSIFLLLLIRIISPIYLIRIDMLFSSRIGHFAANTETYLSEKDKDINIPKCRYVDIFLDGKISNNFLLEKWKKIILIGPRFILNKIYKLNNFFLADLII